MNDISLLDQFFKELQLFFGIKVLLFAECFSFITWFLFKKLVICHLKTQKLLFGPCYMYYIVYFILYI